jgi:hypothetical protein
MGKLENLLSFDDFEKSWKPKEQKATKRTDVGLDVVNENLYMKVMDQTAAGHKENVTKFIQSIMKSVNENQIKDIKVTDNTVSFTIRGRKHRINKDDGSITLWRIKATAFRKTYFDEAGRKKEEKKRTKTREEIEVTIPINKAEATAIYNALKERSED